jgi:hypothetical protein
MEKVSIYERTDIRKTEDLRRLIPKTIPLDRQKIFYHSPRDLALAPVEYPSMERISRQEQLKRRADLKTVPCNLVNSILNGMDKLDRGEFGTLNKELGNPDSPDEDKVEEEPDQVTRILASNDPLSRRPAPPKKGLGKEPRKKPGKKKVRPRTREHNYATLQTAEALQAQRLRDLLIQKEMSRIKSFGKDKDKKKKKKRRTKGNSGSALEDPASGNTEAVSSQRQVIVEDSVVDACGDGIEGALEEMFKETPSDRSGQLGDLDMGILNEFLVFEQPINGMDGDSVGLDSGKNNVPILMYKRVNFGFYLSVTTNT